MATGAGVYVHAVARSTGHAGLQQVCSCSIQQTGVLLLQAGDHQSRALSKYTSLFGIIKERKDNREYRGTMKIRRTIYLCTPHRLRQHQTAGCCGQQLACFDCKHTWKIGPV